MQNHSKTKTKTTNMHSLGKLQKCESTLKRLSKGKLKNNVPEGVLSKTIAVVFLKLESISVFSRECAISGFLFKKNGTAWSSPLCVQVANLRKKWKGASGNSAVMFITNKKVLQEFENKSVTFIDPRKNGIHTYARDKSKLVEINLQGVMIETKDNLNFAIYGAKLPYEKLSPSLILSTDVSVFKTMPIWEMYSEKISLHLARFFFMSQVQYKQEESCDEEEEEQKCEAESSAGRWPISEEDTYVCYKNIADEYSLTPSENSALDFCYEHPLVTDMDDLVTRRYTM